MLAAVLRDFDELALEKIPTPQPEVGEVVVRIVIISHRFPLEDLRKAVEVMGRPERNEVMIHP